MPSITWDQNFIGTIVLPVAGVLVALVIYALQRTKKRLSYQILSINRLQPYEEGQPHRDTEVLIEYRNVGSLPLVREDFRAPISTEFLESEAILAAEPHTPAFAEHVRIEIKVFGRTGTLQPDLLNPGEASFARYTVRGFERTISVTSRIVGIRSIVNSKFRRFLLERFGVLFLFFLGHVFVSMRDSGGPDLLFFPLLAAPYVVLCVVQLFGVLREQCMLSTAWR